MFHKISRDQFRHQINQAISHNLLASGYGSFSLDFQANCNGSSLVSIRNGVHRHFELSRAEITNWLCDSLTVIDLNSDYLPVWKILQSECLAIWNAGGYGSLTLKFARESQGRIAIVEIQGGPSHRIKLPMCSAWPRHSSRAKASFH